MEKQDWINNVLDSRKDLKQVNPDPNNFAKIQAKLNQKVKDVIPLVWLRVAAILILTLSITEVLLIQQNSEEQNNTSEIVSRNSNLLYE